MGLFDRPTVEAGWRKRNNYRVFNRRGHFKSRARSFRHIEEATLRPYDAVRALFEPHLTIREKNNDPWLRHVLALDENGARIPNEFAIRLPDRLKIPV